MNIIKWAISRLQSLASSPATGVLGDIYFDSGADLPKIYTSTGWTSIDTGTGDVVGPASAVDSHLAVFDGTTGKLIKDGGAITSGVTNSAGANVIPKSDGTNLTASLLTDNGTSVSPTTDGTVALGTITKRYTNLILGATGVVGYGNASDSAGYTNGTGPKWNDSNTSAVFQLDVSNITVNRSIAVPNASGTLALLASPTFTGTPTLPTGTIGVTQSAGNSTTAIATTAFVTTADNLKANLISPSFTTPSLGVASGTSLAIPIIGPSADSTTSIKFTKADLSTVVGVWDTTNTRLRVGSGVAPTVALDVTGSASISGALAVQGTTTLGNSSSTDGAIFNINKASGAGIFSVDTSANTTTLASAHSLMWSTDLVLSRAAAASLRLGGANSGSPVSQTLIAQGSRSGTDSNVAGGNLTIVSGIGTGNSTGSSLILSSPVAVASGTGAQTQTATLTLQGGNTTSNGGFSIAVAKPLSMASGTNQRAGNAVLVGGTVTVSNTTVTANTVVLLTRKTSGGTIGTAITYSLSAGTSFTITSDNILDTSTFSYVLVEVP